ncbi:MAG TPA: NAD(P)-dependent oxidoreductase [Streptosporangiaceae bacterium]|nr:NAD(P)-dependent oxidoreductase [Streptosporangiaceae bacterium]
MADDAIAVLGAGSTMGLPMARNLARAGWTMLAWNRSADRAQPLAPDGIRVCATPAQAAAEAGTVLTMLADGEAVTEVMDGPEGAIAAMPQSAIWLQMSTIGEAATERCARLAASRGITFVDAPVLGTREPAEQAKLVILASGPDNARGRVQPVFDVIGRKTIWAGETGAGTRLKLVVNNWILSVLEGGAETIALAEGLRVDPALFFAAIEGGPLDLPFLRTKGKAISERNFEPSFRLTLAAKDARLVSEAAQRHGLDLPLPRVIAQRLAEGATAHGEEDMSATYLTSAPSGAG